MFSAIFHSVIYQPLFNVLIFLYNIIPGQDFGVVIIFVTVLMRLILWPLSNKSIKAQKSMQGLQPKINALKEQYKDNKEKLAQATMELYKTEKINPFASCLPLLIQLPILMGFYWVLSAGLKSQNFEVLYSFVNNPGTIKTLAFGFLDLSRSNIILAVLAGAAQFWQAKMLPTQPPAVKGEGSKDESMTAMMNKQMMYMMPLMTVFIGATLPAGLTLYWLITTLLTVLQQVIVFKKTNGPAIIKN
ncbi:MAG TPA: YidC/Oxa1 family membrane protein insertase [Candidatus Magasanikbacteria bacterium]|nr:YidC/Oxa1 family membrane protein insertase [Candidatus Magasanikbacteria bacterium]